VPQGACDLSRRVFGAPRLRPGPHALFEVGQNAVGDAGINVLPRDPVMLIVVGAGFDVVLLV